MNRWETFRRSPLAALVVVTLAVFTDMLLYDMVVPFLPRYASELGISSTGIGLLFGSYALALLAATPVVGVLSDRYGRRWPMLIGMIGLAAATLLFATAKSLPWLLTARVLQGIAGAASYSVGLALLADVYPPQQRGWAMGTAMSGMAAGTLIGPPFGGILFRWGGYQLPFLVAAVLVAIDALGRALLLADPPRTPGNDLQRVTMWTLLRDANIRVMTGAVAVGALVLSLLEPTLPAHLERVLGAQPAGIGLPFAAATLAYGISAPAVGWLAARWGGRRTVAIGLVATAITLPAVVMATTWTWQVLAMLPFGIACAILLAPTLPELAAGVDRQGGGAYASVYALFNEAYAVGMMVGPLLGGFLAERYGLLATLICVSLVSLAYVPLLRESYKRIIASSPSDPPSGRS